MVTVEKNQPDTAQNDDKSVKRRSEVVEVKINSAESFCSTSQFLAHSGSPDTFVIVKASTQKEDYAIIV